MADNKKYVDNIKKYAKKVDEDLVNALAKTYRLVMSKQDTAYVACGQPKELETVRKNFLKKKLGRTESDEKLDKAIQDVCEKMGRKNSRKSRLTFYYLLAEKYKAKSIFVK